MRKQEGASFGGEAILLEAAVGLVGEGAFDAFGYNSWSQVQFSETFPIFQAQCQLNFLSGHLPFQCH
jgi:hypothetical protein